MTIEQQVEALTDALAILRKAERAAQAEVERPKGIAPAPGTLAALWMLQDAIAWVRFDLMARLDRANCAFTVTTLAQ